MKYLKTSENKIYAQDEETLITMVYNNEKWQLSPVNFVVLERERQNSHLSEVEVQVICKGNLPVNLAKDYINYLDTPRTPNI